VEDGPVVPEPLAAQRPPRKKVLHHPGNGASAGKRRRASSIATDEISSMWTRDGRDNRLM